MAELSFNNLFLISIVFLLQIEIFFYSCYNHYIFYFKLFKLSSTKKINKTIFQEKINKIYFYFYIFIVIFFKVESSDHLFFIIFSLFLINILNTTLSFLNNYVKSNSNIYSIILPLMVSFLFIIPYINSLLLMFFFIELYGVIYYFSFLNTCTLTNQTLLKYKNGLLLLLWNNFLTTFFLGISCFFIIKNYGTTSFCELSTLTSQTKLVYLYLLGVFWKLGLPIFHFFKLEIYKFLLKENVFFFSVITTVFNLIILYYLLKQNIIFNTIYLNNFFFILGIFTFNLIILNLNITNLLYFFAISSLLTMTTTLVVFLL